MRKKQKYIKAVILNAGDFPSIEIIENELEQYQAICEGRIEVLDIGKGVLCILNEEGKLDGLQANFAIGYENSYYDIVVGNVVFVADDGLEFKELSPEQINHALMVSGNGRVALKDIVDKMKIKEG